MEYLSDYEKLLFQNYSILSAYPCKANAEYRAVGPTCVATCVNPKPKTCNGVSGEGCYCKAGYLLDDQKCVQKTACGCLDQLGHYYPVN